MLMYGMYYIGRSKPVLLTLVLIPRVGLGGWGFCGFVC